MVSIIKDWILQIVGAVMLISVAQKIIPDGTIRKASGIISGLIFLMVLLQPLPKIRSMDWESEIKKYERLYEENKEELEDYSEQKWSDEIEKRSEESIEQHAKIYGNDVTVDVEVKMNEKGIPVPYKVYMKGNYIKELAIWIATEFDIPPEQQTWEFQEQSTPS